MTVLLIATLCLNLILAIGVIYEVHRIRAKSDRVTESIAAIFEASGDNGSSEAGRVIDEITSNFSQKIATAVYNTMRGSMGGTMKAVNAELEQTAIAENPALGVMEILPKSLKKNPVAMLGVQSLLQRLIGQNTGSVEASRPAGNGQIKFTL